MIAHAAAAVALLLAQPSATPARPCLTTAELGDLAVVTLPDVLDSFARSCSAHLPETAFLRSGASGFTERLRAGGATRRGPALAALGRVAPPNLRAQISTEAGLKMMTGMVSGQMSSRLNPKTCGELSRFTESLAPLPPENVAMMFSSMAGFFMAMRAPQPGAAAAQGRQGPPICPA
jgi:hypothetical protein